MFKVNIERIEAKANLYTLWDIEDIKEYYFSDDVHFDDIIFESDTFYQAKLFFECEKFDCKTFLDGAYVKIDVLCLYRDEELLELFAVPLH